MVRASRGGDGVTNVRYKGVRMRKWGKWVAEVRQTNSRRRIWLGSYQTADEAARAYDAAVFCLRGHSATLNFPEYPPNIPFASELSPSQIQAAASRHASRIPTDNLNHVMTESNPAVMEYQLCGETSQSYGCLLLGTTSEFYYVTNDQKSGGEGDNGNLVGGALYG